MPLVLEKAADGETFAAIHGEPGNDIPLLLCTGDGCFEEICEQG